MNRRGFLKGLVAVALAGSSFGARARAFVLPRRPPEYLGEDGDSLRAAIERLFPAGVAWSNKAYEEYGFGESKPVYWPEAPPYDGPGKIQRVVHRTFALAHVVGGNAALNARLHRALYQSMYWTWVQIAERPENRGAVLVWRVTPEESVGRETAWDFGLNMEKDVGPLTCRLRIRASLRQRGWRERLGVAPWMEGAKPEGAATWRIS